MITEEQIAAARIAQMFGGELMRVDENTINLNSNMPATRIDPKKILISGAGMQQANKDRERQIEDRLHREAMAAYPEPPPPPPAVHTPAAQAAPTSLVSGAVEEQLKDINKNLERIACALENFKLS